MGLKWKDEEKKIVKIDYSNVTGYRVELKSIFAHSFIDKNQYYVERGKSFMRS